ncbi:hypothetical protein GCM10010464_12640 [Pseudonocardia yunnanensis]
MDDRCSEAPIKAPRIRSGGAKSVPKLLIVIAGMCAGADSIDEVPKTSRRVPIAREH